MTTFEQFRWQTVAALPVTALARRIAAVVRRQEKSNCQAGESHRDADDLVPSPWHQNLTKRAQRVALARLLDADCASCHGYGCDLCAGTGLA